MTVNNGPGRAGYWRGDRLEVSMRYAYRPEFVPLLLEYLGVSRGASILEIGCGSGFLSRLIARHAADVRVLGLDTDPDMLEIAAQLVERDRLTGPATLAQGDTYRLPFAAGSFDLVTSHRVL